MIFSFTDEPINSPRWSDADLAELIDTMITKGHYPDWDGNWFARIEKAIANHGGTNARDRFGKFVAVPLTGEMRRYLTTVRIHDLNRDQVEKLASLPALVFLENARNEWPIYSKLIDLAVSDSREFRNPFKLLQRADKEYRLHAHAAGGAGEMPGEFQRLDQNEYRDVAKHKICLLFDRDTPAEFDDEGVCLFDENKNGLFRLLCGKEACDMNYDDIYVLHQPSDYVWHMWHKRAVENYIPNSAFQSMRLNTNVLPANPKERDYFKIDGTSLQNYGKSSLPKLAPKLTWKEVNRACRTFDTEGLRNVSELQLLLLKWVKII